MNPASLLNWTSDKRCEINGVRFFATSAPADYEIKSTPDEFLLLKNRHAIDVEMGLLADRNVRNILDVGIWQGGSIALFDQLLAPDVIVAIDFKKERIPALDDYIARRAKARIQALHAFNQADTPRVTQILNENFPNGIDVIVDDASHFYEESRATFCAAFPHLNPGGLYIVEDWGWAHWPYRTWEQNYFRGKTALTNLITETAIVCANAPQIVSEVRVIPSVFVVTRGNSALPKQPLDLSALTKSKDQPFVAVL